MNRYRIIGIIIYVAVFGMLIGSLFVYYNTQTFIEKSFSTTGTVIDMTTPNYGRAWYILISFETAKNESVQIKLYDSRNTPAHAIGDKVPILYDPDNPQKVEINSFFRLWDNFLLLFLPGAVFTGLILFGLIARGTFLYRKRSLLAAKELQKDNSQIRPR